MSTRVVVEPRKRLDCYARPYLREGWEIVYHKQGCFPVWDPGKVGLYLSKAQREGRAIMGTLLLQELERKKIRVLNANVLDFLLAHPDLIPAEWRDGAQGKYIVSIYFWGTVYHDTAGNLCVPCFYWSDGMPEWGYSVLRDSLSILDHAAILIA